jgi:hypothetical protein
MGRRDDGQLLWRDVECRARARLHECHRLKRFRRRAHERRAIDVPDAGDQPSSGVDDGNGSEMGRFD